MSSYADDSIYVRPLPTCLSALAMLMPIYSQATSSLLTMVSPVGGRVSSSDPILTISYVILSPSYPQTSPNRRVAFFSRVVKLSRFSWTLKS